jgi:hypothetical protein
MGPNILCCRVDGSAGYLVRDIYGPELYPFSLSGTVRRLRFDQ